MTFINRIFNLKNKKMFDNKHKYVRIKEYNQFIFFPITTEHSTFKHLNPISAGFCYLDNEDKRIRCFGKSHSLGIGAMEDDTNLATKQVYGIDAMLALL